MIQVSPWTHKIQQKTALKRVTHDFIMGLNVSRLDSVEPNCK